MPDLFYINYLVYRRISSGVTGTVACNKGRHRIFVGSGRRKESGPNDLEVNLKLGLPCVPLTFIDA